MSKWQECILEHTYSEMTAWVDCLRLTDPLSFWMVVFIFVVGVAIAVLYSQTGVGERHPCPRPLRRYTEGSKGDG